MPETKIDASSTVSLREVTKDTVRAVCKLSETLSEAQKHAVADNAVSIAEAYFEKKAWFRAIYADETLAGFIMLYDSPEEAEFVLWRMMIARPYQKLGFGGKAIGLLLDYVNTRPGAKELLVSCTEGEASPIKFYEKLGFQRSSEMWGHEVVLKLLL